jgi:sulfatase modifying factor 1
MTHSDKPVEKSCCVTARVEHVRAQNQIYTPDRTTLTRETVTIPMCSSWIRTDRPELKLDCEAPLRKSKLKPFEMDITTVTNARFAAFVEATGYAFINASIDRIAIIRSLVIVTGTLQ